MTVPFFTKITNPLWCAGRRATPAHQDGSVGGPGAEQRPEESKSHA